jgi:hypothetical protein
MPIVLKSGSLNLLEPSGSVQASNGIALPLPLSVGIAQQPKRIQPSGKPPRRTSQCKSCIIAACCGLFAMPPATSALFTEKNQENFKHPGRRSNQSPANNVPEAFSLAADIIVSTASVILLSLSSLQ